MTTFTRSVGLVTRRLLRNPAFTLIAIATLAIGIGIGANTAIFSLVNGILLKPLPFDEPDELVGVWHTAPGLGFEQVNQSPALHYTYLEEGRSFSEIGMWDNGTASVTGIEEPEQVEIMWVTEGTFRALRAQPALGRRFTADDDTPGTPETVILSYPYWQTRFGGDPGILGKTLVVDGRPAPGDHWGHGRRGPLPAIRSGLLPPFPLRPHPALRGELQLPGHGPAGPRGDHGAGQRRREPDGAPFRGEVPGGDHAGDDQEHGARRQPPPPQGPRGGGRGRGPLGAPRHRRDDPAHGLRQRGQPLPGQGRGAGAGDGRPDCHGGGPAPHRRGIPQGKPPPGAPWRPRGRDPGLGRAEAPDGHGAPGAPPPGGSGPGSPGSAVHPGHIPRLRCVLRDVPGAEVPKGGARRRPEGGGPWGECGARPARARNVLVVAQMALALLLLVGSGLMVRSFQALRNVDPGFRDPEEVLLVRLNILPAEVGDPVAAARTHQLLHDRLAAVPGVTAVGLSSSATMDGYDSNDPIFVEGFPVPEEQVPPIRRFKWVGEDYFAAMRIPVVAGRAIDWRDSFDLKHVAMMTESLAREYWETPAEAVGKRISTGFAAESWAEVVGVVGDVRDDGLDQDPTAVVYWPLMQRNLFWSGLPGDGEDPEVIARRSMNYVIRSPRVGSPDFLAQVRDAIWEVNPNLPLANVQALDDLLARSVARTSFSLVMLGIAAAVALVLGAIGIYGVISYVVSQRTRELGVRLALGASAVQVQGMVLRQGLTLAGIGVALGLAGAVGLTRLMAALLYGVEPVDPVTFGTMAVALTLVAALASWVPARRAARTDPLEAIRWE